MTVAEAAFNVIEQLGMTTDDAPDERLPIAWLDTARAAAIQKYVDENGEIPESVIVRRSCLLATENSDECDNCVYRYVDLPFGALDLRGDDGVVAVFRPRTGPGPGVAIEHVKNSEVGILRNFKFYRGGWRRIGERIYIDMKLPVGARLTIHFIPASVINLALTDEFPAPGGMLTDIIQTAVEIGKRKLNEDPLSDGDFNMINHG